jgi:DNA-binding IclR family transcriptional regulator
MTIQSVDRALKILSLFSPSTPVLGVTDISKKMNLAKPTAHGLIQTLVDNGFLLKDSDTKKYSLGLKIYELGIFLSGTLKINQAGYQALQRLSKKTGLMARIAIWNNGDVLVTLNLMPDVQIPMFQQLGPSVPAHCTGIGKAILSTFTPETLENYLSVTGLEKYTENTITDKSRLIRELEASAKRGYCLEKEEFMKGLSCIAVPVLNSSGKVEGSVSLSGNATLKSAFSFEELVSSLINTAGEISINLGYYPKSGF